MKMLIDLCLPLVAVAQRDDEIATSLSMCYVMQTFVNGWGMLADVREAEDHSDMVVVVVVKVGTGALALL